MESAAARRNRWEAFSRLYQTHFARYSMISSDPLIFHVQANLDMVDQFLPSYQVLFAELRGRRAYCLFRNSSALSRRLFEWILQLETRCMEQFPDITWIHLCNKPGQAEQFQLRGRRAILCNSNCFVDESVFRPLPSTAKRFDAVYNARLDKLKRHFLAEDIASLALISGSMDGELEYIHETRRRLSHAYSFNHSKSGEYRMLPREEVNACLNACRVGLCLSENEGPMFASAEYLLSGLPIVTTPSPGGRDVFFEDRFVLTVAPDPQAISQAVREVIGWKVPPEIPRSAMLEKIRSHREAFISLVQEIYDENGIQRRFIDEWPRVFPGQTLTIQSHTETLAKLGWTPA